MLTFVFGKPPRQNNGTSCNLVATLSGNREWIASKWDRQSLHGGHSCVAVKHIFCTSVPLTSTHISSYAQLRTCTEVEQRTPVDFLQKCMVLAKRSTL